MDEEFKKYLTIGDYFKTLIIFLPTFILVSVLLGLFAGTMNGVIMIVALLMTICILYLRLLYVSSIRKKENKMMWEAKVAFEAKNKNQENNF